MTKIYQILIFCQLIGVIHADMVYCQDMKFTTPYKGVLRAKEVYGDEGNLCVVPRSYELVTPTVYRRSGNDTEAPPLPSPPSIPSNFSMSLVAFQFDNKKGVGGHKCRQTADCQKKFENLGIGDYMKCMTVLDSFYDDLPQPAKYRNDRVAAMCFMELPENLTTKGVDCCPGRHADCPRAHFCHTKTAKCVELSADFQTGYPFLKNGEECQNHYDCMEFHTNTSLVVKCNATVQHNQTLRVCLAELEDKFKCKIGKRLESKGRAIGCDTNRDCGGNGAICDKDWHVCCEHNNLCPDRITPMSNTTECPPVSWDDKTNNIILQWNSSFTTWIKCDKNDEPPESYRFVYCSNGNVTYFGKHAIFTDQKCKSTSDCGERKVCGRMFVNQTFCFYDPEIPINRRFVPRVVYSTSARIVVIAFLLLILFIIIHRKSRHWYLTLLYFMGRGKRGIHHFDQKMARAWCEARIKEAMKNGDWQRVEMYREYLTIEEPYDDYEDLVEDDDEYSDDSDRK